MSKLTSYEAMILDALATCEAPVQITALIEIADPRNAQNLDGEKFYETLLALSKHGYVDQIHPTMEHLYSRFFITTKGRACLIGREAQQVFDECAAHAPFVPTCRRRLEPEEPATAILCLDEDELDDWWESLDVEMKADAFTNFALRMHTGEDNHIYIEPKHPSIPVTGAIGPAFTKSMEARCDREA
jgi:hypothetical protein